MDKFINEQKREYNIALREIEKGKKMSHWIWYIFPQITGLGQSFMCKRYDIQNIEEAKEYLNNDILRYNLIKICEALLKHAGKKNICEIMGYDDVKLLSCMTLFDEADEKNKCKGIFKIVIKKFYDGKKDEKTLSILDYQKKLKTINKQTNKNEINDNNNNDKSQINDVNNINKNNNVINDNNIFDKEQNKEINNNQINKNNKVKVKNNVNNNEVHNNNNNDDHQMDIINNSPQNSYTNINDQKTKLEVGKMDNNNEIYSESTVEKMDIEECHQNSDVKKTDDKESHQKDSIEEMDKEKFQSQNSMMDEKKKLFK